MDNKGYNIVIQISIEENIIQLRQYLKPEERQKYNTNTEAKKHLEDAKAEVEKAKFIFKGGNNYEI